MFIPKSNIKIDQLIRSRRKTIGLQITNDARLIVRAPLFASEDYIHKLISRKESWIKSKQTLFLQRPQTPPRRFLPGEEFLFLGQSYTLKTVEDLPKAVILENNSLMISQQVLANTRDHLECWYKAQALEYITQKIEQYVNIFDLKYKSIRVNEASTRWGSCGYRDSLNFTWRLIMAPGRVVDYVIIHELMHLKQKNHSHKFWAEVAKAIPDYKQDELWLKKNGHLLTWD